MQYTNCITYKLLDDEDLSRINLLINNTNDADWTDGLKSTTHNNKEIKNNLEKISSSLLERSIDVKDKLLEFLEADKARRSTQSELDSVLAESN